MGRAIALSGGAIDRLLLLDAYRRAAALGASTELYVEALGNDPFLVHPSSDSSWANAEVILVGAPLAAAFRPMARDLAASLAAPGSADEKLEAAAERLLDGDERLTVERLEQERRCGIVLHEDGSMNFEGALLDRQGLAGCLRPFWSTRRAPKGLLGFATVQAARSKSIDRATSWVLIHDQAGPDRMPGALRCPLTGKRLGLAGADAPRLVDRIQEQNYALWAWLEPAIEEGVSVLIASDRDQLLSAWAKAWFSAP